LLPDSPGVFPSNPNSAPTFDPQLRRVWARGARPSPRVCGEVDFQFPQCFGATGRLGVDRRIQVMAGKPSASRWSAHSGGRLRSMKSPSVISWGWRPARIASWMSGAKKARQIRRRW